MGTALLSNAAYGMVQRWTRFLPFGRVASAALVAAGREEQDMEDVAPYHGNEESDRPMVPGLLLCLAGGIWTFVLFNPLVFPVLDDGIGGTVAEQAQAIDESFAEWRLAWLVNMPARLLIAVGLFLFCRALAARETGLRSKAATAAAWAGLINAPLGVARFLITFGDADYAADPGLWFGLLWGAHWIGTILACLVIAWLTFGSIAPRLAVAVLVAFTIVTTALVSGPPAYTGLGVYAGAALWRSRKRSPQGHTGTELEITS